ncbi:MAG: membrane protein insertion efficiency factor YidD [Thermoleophilaceae bacterium]|nr:membrane protein insertion efficiency factor YidD [Thermoleophilaceae bacterium]
MTSTSTSQNFGARLRRAATLPFLLPVLVYRKLISPFIAPRCRYYPSCSTYAVDALKEYGPIRGSVLAAWRVVRCNPFSDGGFDYVEDQKLFKQHSHDCDEKHKRHGVSA